MKLRELRNTLVFWAAFFGLGYVFKEQQQQGWILSIALSLGGSLGVVVVTALVTDRFME